MKDLGEINLFCDKRTPRPNEIVYPLKTSAPQQKCVLLDGWRDGCCLGNLQSLIRELLINLMFTVT